MPKHLPEQIIPRPLGRRVRELREIDPSMRKRQKYLRPIPKFTGATKKRGLQFVQERISTMENITKMLREYRKRAGKWPQDRDYVAEAMRDGSHWWAQYNAAADACIKIKETYTKKIRKAEREGKKAALSRKRLREVSKVCGSKKITKNPLSKAKTDFDRTIGNFSGCLCPKPGAKDPLLSMIELLRERRGRPTTFEREYLAPASQYIARPRGPGRPSAAELRRRETYKEFLARMARQEDPSVARAREAAERRLALRAGKPLPKTKEERAYNQTFEEPLVSQSTIFAPEIRLVDKTRIEKVMEKKARRRGV